jgi:mono/diheme cytochrome c family protein
MVRLGIRVNARLALVLWSGGLSFASMSCSTPGDDPGPALPVDPAAIYAQMCGRCHGPDGRGDPELKKTLPVRDFSDATFQARSTSEEIARTIMAGKNQMPAFGALLSPPKIQSLSGFVKRLGRMAPSADAPVDRN